jgi:hypothetical protein
VTRRAAGFPVGAAAGLEELPRDERIARAHIGGRDQLQAVPETTGMDALAPVFEPWKPKATVCPGWIAAFQLRLPAP